MGDYTNQLTPNPRNEEMFNRDFVPYYCEKRKRHFWVLGYFGGGGINFKRLESAVEHFVKYTGVNINTVYVDELYRSRRFKQFRFLSSTDTNQIKFDWCRSTKDVMAWLND